MPRTLRWSKGGGQFLMSEAPLYLIVAPSNPSFFSPMANRAGRPSLVQEVKSSNPGAINRTAAHEGGNQPGRAARSMAALMLLTGAGGKEFNHRRVLLIPPTNHLLALPRHTPLLRKNSYRDTHPCLGITFVSVGSAL